MLEEPVYTIINGVKIEWPSGVQIVRRDGISILKEGKEEQNLQRYPLIIEEDGEIVLQRSCSYNRTSVDEISRLDYFGRLSRDEEGIVVRSRGKEIRNVEGFIYDNEDTYVFLERALLRWGEESLIIEPLTIVQVSYMDYMQIFGPGLEPRFEELETDAVTAEFDSGKTLNLATDRYYAKNGAWRLLFLPLDMLPEMKSGGASNEEE